MALWWCSFCDPDKPHGSQFLGALVIRADSVYEISSRAWELGLNPGGEVLMYQIPEYYVQRVPQEWIETRLITKEECDAFEKQWAN